MQRDTFFYSAALAAAFCAASAMSAWSDTERVDHVEIGSLDCEVEDSDALLSLKQSRELSCTFNPVQEGLEDETYVGEITRFGLNVGKTQNAVIEWLVLAPTEKSYAEGGLEGEYSGISAQATLGAGVEGNVMLGGDDQLTLQPISVGAQTGVNFAAGVGQITLTRVSG